MTSNQNTPPASPPAPVPPIPTAEPADTAVEGREVVCIDALLLSLGIGEAVERFKRDGDRERLGIELLRISNELATESKRLRAIAAPPEAAALRQEADEIRKAARELTAPMHRADECKCTHGEGEPLARVRYPSRYCPVPEHASEWQTLAEQRSELHDDGTPRAGCGYCASTPELDERERGLSR